MDSQDDQANLTHTKKLGTREFEFYCKSQPQLSPLIFSLEDKLKNCEDFYYDSILMTNKGHSIYSIQKRLKIQLQKVNEQKSFYHITRRSIQARVKCIQRIRSQLLKAQKSLSLFKKHYTNKHNISHQTYIQYIQEEGYSNVQIEQTVEEAISLIRQLFLDMARLRDITIYIVESVHEWKTQVEEWTHKCGRWEEMLFLFNNRNIYDVILTDSEFIWQSVLNEYIYTSTSQDPFLIHNVLKVSQRQEKTILEKYFIQLLYPKTQVIIDKAIKSYEMLTYKFTPKMDNTQKQEEILIENYLNLKKQQEQLEAIDQIDQRQFEWEFNKRNFKSIQKKHNLQNQIFRRNLKKPTHQRVRQLVQRHQYQITFLKPIDVKKSSILNSPALGHLKTNKLGFSPHIRQKSPLKTNYQNAENTKLSKKPYSTQPILRSLSQKRAQSLNNKQKDKLIKNSRSISSYNWPNKMYQSLTKLSPVTILEDPHENNEQTPRNIPHFTKAKINETLLMLSQNEQTSNPLKVEKQNYKQPKIDSKRPNIPRIKEQPAQQEQTINNRQRKNILQKNQQRLAAVRQLLYIYRSGKGLLTPPLKSYSQLNALKIVSSQNKKSNPQKKQSVDAKNNNLSKNLLLSKNQLKKDTSINSKYSSPPVNEKKSHKSSIVLPQHEISLKPKSIPFDIIPAYVSYIFKQLNPTSKKFTLYSQKQITLKLQDSLKRCIIFDIHNTEKGHIGQVILSQSYSITDKKLTYTIEFINVAVFELFVLTLLKVAEELLLMTPCERVIYRLYEDSLDPVSVHFVNLIQNALKQKTPAFGKLSIIEKKRLSQKQIQLCEKQCIFETTTKKLEQLKFVNSSMGNYRSLKMQCKCLILSSNFRMRSKIGTKQTISHYDTVSMGNLYLGVLARIMTKGHLKQVKYMLKGGMLPSGTNSEQDNISAAVQQKNEFLRTSIMLLRQHLLKSTNSQGTIKTTGNLSIEQPQEQEQLIKMTKFTHMPELLNYLEYRSHSRVFDFTFLEQSRFLLNHQLYLTELDLILSLEFSVQDSVGFLLLRNHMNKNISIIENENNHQQYPIPKGIILPTTNKNIDLIFIDGKQYLKQASLQSDLFSYLYRYQKQNFPHIKISQTVRQIAIPKIHGQSNNQSNTVKMFDGLLRLFPQRQFYSATHFKTHNYWQTRFPPAVIHKPQDGCVIFQYPLIVGFVDKQSQQILTGFLLKSED